MHTGIGVSSGIAIGKAYLFLPERVKIRKTTISAGEVDAEIARFREALEMSEQQIMDIKEEVSKRRLADHVHIFDAHMLILHDRALWNEIFDTVRTKRINLEWALELVKQKYSKLFSELQDEVFREKRSDIHDVLDRLLENLIGDPPCPIDEMPPDSILFARDLPPSMTICLDLEHLKGIVTEVGGRTSHLAILSRAFGIPSIAGLEGITQEVIDGDAVIIDGTSGEVIIRPSKAIAMDYKRRQKSEHFFEQELLKSRDLPSETVDGYYIELAANIELLRETDVVREYGASSIGLYRTEFLYMNRLNIPDEEEHYAVYRQLAEILYPEKAVIRTLDIGGDKLMSDMTSLNTMRDFMGLRAIRLCFKRLDIFKTQLRGIIRANVHGNLKIMFPMISGLEELQTAKEIYFSVLDELQEEGHEIVEMELGIMIEVPSSAMVADLLASEVDFFSIGTNDLIQYSLAIDRVNKEVAYLYEPFHPAILRTIQHVTDIAHQHGIRVAVCGEMAGEPLYAPALIGMGIDELSMTATSIPRIKRIIRNMKFSDARNLTALVMKKSDPEKMKELTKQFLNDLNIQVN